MSVRSKLRKQYRYADSISGRKLSSVKKYTDEAYASINKSLLQGTGICNYGTERDIISVFCFDHGDHSDRDVKILTDLTEALYVRDTLIQHGWKKLIPPKIEFTISSDDGKQKPLNRKERRYLEKKIKQVARQQNHSPAKILMVSDPSNTWATFG